MRPLAHFLLACFLAIVSATTSAIEQVVISLGTLEGNGWAAEGVELVTDALLTPASHAQLRIARLVLSEPDFAFSGLDIHCQSFQVTGSGITCADGTLLANNVFDMRLAGDISIDYTYSGDVSVTATLDQFVGGRLSVAVSHRESKLFARLRSTGLDSAALLEFARKISVVPDYQVAGRIDLELEYEPKNAGNEVVSLALAGSDISFSNDTGTQAGENITLALSSKATRIASGWGLNVKANLQRGLLYIDPIYVDAGEQGVMLRADGVWRSGPNEFRLSKLAYNHKDVLEGSVKALVKLSPSITVPEFDIRVDEAKFPAAYQTYIQPWVYGSVLGDLDTEGQIGGRVARNGSEIRRFDIDLASVGLTDKSGRFSLSGLEGKAGWVDDDQVRTADLQWQSGSVYRITLGKTHLPLVFDRDSVALRESVQIPVLDGDLMIDHWQLAQPGKPEMNWSFDGVLTPISLEDISNALDWPPFAGRLSGVIPDVRYADGRLTIGGVLLVRAFDGDFTVRDLSLEQPFGLVPRLSANLALDNLDLEQLTSAFSFGKIEGRLNGRISDLKLVNWQPVAFDAAFANPDDDDARHRISQKAIDNLSNIGGGGVGNALSKTFLGMFKDFPYDRLGISCRLERGVCHMGGVAPAPGGYYIVKGRFLPPRIDIVGYSDRVDWESLLARIKAAIGSGGATIQ